MSSFIAGFLLLDFGAALEVTAVAGLLVVLTLAAGVILVLLETLVFVG